jgi:hypothetical protein
VRVLGIDYNLTNNWKWHPVLGWSQIPRARYQVEVEGRSIWVSFNALGFRDDEHTFAKPDGVKRIVVIGDSFSEAVQVNLEETFHRLLQERLNRDGHDRWEIINLGVGDFGSAQEWIALEKYGLRYSPDVVIQEVFPLNDICNNSIELYELCGSGNDRYRPYFVERDGRLELTTEQPVRNFLRRHSVSYGVVEHTVLALQPFDPDARDLIAWKRGMKLEPLIGVFEDEAHQDHWLVQAWSITEKILAKTAALARAHGSRYLAVVVPCDGQLGDWPPRSAGREPVDVDHPERRLGDFYAGLGEPVVLLKPEFARHKAEVMPYVDGHLGAGGHRIMAEQLYERMVRLGWAR